jgi:hypothetical protein
MWNAPLVKALRWLIYIPSVFIVLSLVSYLFGNLMLWVMNLNFSTGVLIALSFLADCYGRLSRWGLYSSPYILPWFIQIQNLEVKSFHL